jgi:hypothetical protein
MKLEINEIHFLLKIKINYNLGLCILTTKKHAPPAVKQNIVQKCL